MKFKKKEIITYGLYMEKPMVETYKGEKNEKLKKSLNMFQIPPSCPHSCMADLNHSFPQLPLRFKNDAVYIIPSFLMPLSCMLA